jgi:hypothetical protein
MNGRRLVVAVGDSQLALIEAGETEVMTAV